MDKNSNIKMDKNSNIQIEEDSDINIEKYLNINNDIKKDKNFDIKIKFIIALTYNILHLYYDKEYKYKNDDYISSLKYYIYIYYYINNNKNVNILSNSDKIHIINILSCYSTNELNYIKNNNNYIEKLIKNKKHNLDKMIVKTLIILLNIYKNENKIKYFDKIKFLESKILENLNESDIIYIDLELIYKYINNLKNENNNLKNENFNLKKKCNE
jgi:hypothetical protein